MTNIEEGARHAAEWVAYCNLPVGRHPMANLRKEHGRRYPAKVIYWELDNEAFRWFSTAEQYAHACFIYAKAMKAIDPEIKLGMCTYGGHLSNRLDTMLQIAGFVYRFSC
jgi:alpha-N-arabinofuranosidase